MQQLQAGRKDLSRRRWELKRRLCGGIFQRGFVVVARLPSRLPEPLYHLYADVWTRVVRIQSLSVERKLKNPDLFRS